MKRAWITALLLAALAACGHVGLTSTAEAEPRGGKPRSVRLGLMATLFRNATEEMIPAMTRPMRTLMEAQTGYQGEVVRVTDAADLGQKLADGEVDLAVFHGFEFAWARQKHPTLKPLVIAVNHDRTLHACLVVRRDSGLGGIADLKGKSVSLAQSCREHCRLFLERRCSSACGEPTTAWFGQVVTPFDMEEALDQVVRGQAQAAVVDAVALAQYRRSKAAAFAKLKVAEQSEPFPAAVIAYQPGKLDDGVIRLFHNGLTTANQTRRGQVLLSMSRMTSFESVPADYEQNLLEIAKVYPPGPADGAAAGQTGGK